MSESLPTEFNSNKLAACTAIIPELVFRYVKPSHIDDGDVLEEAFQLREDRSPPEEYISFYFSEKETDMERLKCVENRMCSRGFKFSKNGGLLKINTVEAIESVNTVRDLIKFEHKSTKKVGMHYLSKNPIDIIEARTTLAYLAQFNSKKTF